MSGRGWRELEGCGLGPEFGREDWRGILGRLAGLEPGSPHAVGGGSDQTAGRRRRNLQGRGCS